MSLVQALCVAVMAVRHRDRREQDLTEIARRYLMGETQSTIAESLKVSQQTISADMKLIRKRWRDSSIRDFDEAIAVELAKIDLVEAEFWEQWEKSKLPKQVKKNEKADGFTKQTTIEETKCGNPAFLAGVLNCIDRRCRLLGLDSEIKYQDLTTAIAKVIQAGFKVEQSDRAN
ncbi:hypothetical protein [Leptolyngbya sp. NIES-2104]|uniref:hypothetical protein n=1 Tax=Leptolyngbya sp. NIES-2104 TaxID=1552121 RepID=UPI0006ECC003|nr:hypothetical protein [Leptolyngbya sp. NIES-2104]GAP96084.1 phage protein [Leptolyngbya sp. NIES-2104]